MAQKGLLYSDNGLVYAPYRGWFISAHNLRQFKVAEYMCAVKEVESNTPTKCPLHIMSKYIFHLKCILTSSCKDSLIKVCMYIESELNCSLIMLIRACHKLVHCLCFVSFKSCY